MWTDESLQQRVFVLVSFWKASQELTLKDVPFFPNSRKIVLKGTQKTFSRHTAETSIMDMTVAKLIRTFHSLVLLYM